MPRVVLAMSGGVDSSVAAFLLKQQGYEVIGLFMRTGVHIEEACATDRGSHKKGCCSSLDARDARRVADRLDIPFYALDFEEDFGRIMDYFVDEYAAGRTPNPCIMCNNWLKFGKLWSYGRHLGADYVATGHHARVLRQQGETELHVAADPDKDQSYVLFGVRRPVLDRLLFPVGELTKDAVRALARDAGLPVFNKPDSQEICFVPHGDHAAFIRRRRPGLATSGSIRDTSGRELARHDGIERFTIGQRKGLGFAAGERRFVLEIIPEDRTVIVGNREELNRAGLFARDVNWLVAAPPAEGGGLSCQVKIRYRSRPADARVFPLADRQVRVEFAQPQPAVTPGQAAVFYRGGQVLGGGWITAAL